MATPPVPDSQSTARLPACGIARWPASASAWPRYPAAMMTPLQTRFLEAARVAHLATADRNGVPHVVPVCFCLLNGALFISIDEKPKRTDRLLKRLRNIQENPSVAVTMDRWDEDWRRLAWVMLRGRAEILPDGMEHDAAQNRLRDRYPQYQAMRLTDLPVIAVRIHRVLSWGAL
jgi:PPOX class probable F420-dependent enzyme